MIDIVNWLSAARSRRCCEHEAEFNDRIVAVNLLRFLPFALLAATITAASVIYLVPFSYEFPIDDAYIHIVYAENLSSSGKFYFNEAGETGLGVTSPFWVVLLAAADYIGFPVHGMAKILGIFSLILVSFLIYLLTRLYLGKKMALMLALFIGLSGNMLWFALSGMETLLFLALGMLALWFYGQRQMIWLGIVLGLLILTRPEGAALALAITLIELVLPTVKRRELVQMLILCIVISLSWFLYLYGRTGYLLPTSAVGKQVSFRTGILAVAEQNPWLAHLVQMPPLIYVASWMVYLAMFALGGMALPKPYLSVGTLVGNPNYQLSVWSLFVWIVIIFPIVGGAIRGMIRMRARIPNHPGILALCLWVILHNTCFMLFLPVPGTASRYGAINYILLWLLLIAGLVEISSRKLWRRWLFIGLLLIGMTNFFYWNRVYDANLEFMQQVRIAAADFVHQLPANEHCAAFDIGATRYFSRQPVIDLGGLIDPQVTEQFLSDRLDRYIVDQEITCLLLPGRMSIKRDGWFDMANLMGFASSPLFELQLIEVYEIEHDRWLLGYLPTNNYQATISIYRVVPR